METLRNDFWVLYYKRRISVWMEKSQLVLVHKLNDEQLLRNHRPVSLLPIFGKSFDRIIYNSIFEYLTTSKLILDNHSGFKPSESCVNQLLSITHEIYHSLDNGLDVRGFLTKYSQIFWQSMENRLPLIKCFRKNC